MGEFYSGVYPERPEPDLAVTAAFSRDDKWCLIKRRINKETTYYLELLDWRVHESRWERDTVDIQYLQDLTSAQLFINIGGQRDAPAVRQKMVIETIDLRINGQPVAIEPKTLQRHTGTNRWQKGQPFWEYTFPGSASMMFRTSDATAR